MGALGLGPSLALRQRGGPAAFDFMGGALPPGAALTRASTGTRINGAGLIVPAGVNVARFDHDPVGGALRGLLIEPAATNELKDSAALDTANWTRSGGATVTADGSIVPDGMMAGDQLTDAGTSFASVGQTLSTTVTRTISCFVRKDAIGRDTRFAMIRAGGDCCVDTATGEISAGTGISAARTIDHGGWWRLVFSASSAGQVQIYPALGAGAAWTYNGATTGGATFWGAQAETGPEASSYIATAGAAAARAADVLTLEWGMRGVADGAMTARVTFDDLTTQDVAMTVAGGAAALAASALARSRVRRIARV